MSEAWSLAAAVGGQQQAFMQAARHDIHSKREAPMYDMLGLSLPDSSPQGFCRRSGAAAFLLDVTQSSLLELACRLVMSNAAAGTCSGSALDSR